MSELHVMFLKDRRSISGEAWLDLVDRGVLRAAVNPINGPFRVGFGAYSSLVAPDGTAGTPEETVSAAYAFVCPDPDTVPCELLRMVPIRGVPSYVPPNVEVAFVLLTLRRGRLSAWAEELGAAEELGGTQTLAALTFGTAGVDAVVEVVAGDSESLHRQLIAVTDHPSVATARVLYASPRRTRGFGAGRAAHTD